MRVAVLEDGWLEIWGRLKRSTAGACAVLLSQLSRKNLTGNNVLFQNWYFLGVKNISRHTHKIGSWGGATTGTIPNESLPRSSEWNNYSC